MSYRPDYLSYNVPCPLNAGKLVQVVNFVKRWRELAKRESDWQWQYFFKTGGSSGFQSSAKAGWTRPWVVSKEATVTLSQQVMAQVAGQLKGHLGQIENTFAKLVAGSSLCDNDRHRLFFLNRNQLWLFHGAVKSPILGEAVLPENIRFLGRKLFHQALSQHRRPHFRRYHPQLDQRSVRLVMAKQRKDDKKSTVFPLWANVVVTPGSSVALPILAWEDLLKIIEQTSQSLEPIVQSRELEKIKKAELKRLASGGQPVPPPLPSPSSKLYSLSQTIRLIVNQHDKGNPSSPKSLSIGVVVDHHAVRKVSRESYTPTPGKIVSFDLGGSVLLATNEGDLLGRNWLKQIEGWDAQLSNIAKGQQRRGLPVSTARYRKILQSMNGFLKTNIFRIINSWVSRVKPEKIIREKTTFHMAPSLSRRLNRLFSHFGKRYLDLALKRLESTHGIVVEFRESSYTSQQCSKCGYIDKSNRASQSCFKCRFCGKIINADVNAARVLRDRRSVVVSHSFPAQRKRLLHAQVLAFQADFPFVSRSVFVEGQPLVCGRKDDPRWNNPYFREVCKEFLELANSTPPSVFARLEPKPIRNANRAK